MTEPKPDSDHISSFFPKSHRSGADDRNPLMDFDLDLDIPWPLDQTPLFSTSDHLASPLWAFSEADDGDDSKFAAYACSVLGELRFYFAFVFTAFCLICYLVDFDFDFDFDLTEWFL